ncbi:MAG: DNA/RNA non-specific endonuclease [Vicingaceae bacterium]|nr:DNA/RNA non-specific endonuclease [Vicingaceae bacterium]
MIKKIVFLFVFTPSVFFGQSVEDKITKLNKELDLIEAQKSKKQKELNGFKLEKIREDIQAIGLPKVEVGEEVINHLAYSLVYSEKHEQAKWVSHIITADIIDGKVKRSNNFRKDPLVKTESASEKDYFLKYKDEKTGKYKYDGFGYDRGHLAPSADFRWSSEALSESYFYSNMSPQLADFNRKKWADLEGLLRGYINDHPETQLYVVTGPVLNDSLPKQVRSENGLSIPNYYYKVALDLKNQKAIAFIMPNKDIKYPISSFSVSINEVEQTTGIDFFYQLSDSLEESLESQNYVVDWVPEKQKGDVKPISQPTLKPGVYNTVQAKRHMGTGKKVTVAGTIVSGRKTTNGHLFFNLDKNYPNQIFTVAIWKKNIANFSYDPLIELKGKQVYLTGKVADFDGIPTMIIEKENAVEVHQDGKMIMVIGGGGN